MPMRASVLGFTSGWSSVTLHGCPLQIDLVMDGRNVFVTGCAGTGKSATVNAILERLHQKYGADYKTKVAVTGMTGMAATLVHGTHGVACTACTHSASLHASRGDLGQSHLCAVPQAQLGAAVQ